MDSYDQVLVTGDEMKALLPKHYCPKNRLDFFKEGFEVYAFEVTPQGECVGIYVFNTMGEEISFADMSSVVQMGVEAFADRKYTVVRSLEEGA
jgi:hypothetical protein